MNPKEAIEVFKGFNAFRANPTGLPPHFPEPGELNDACDAVVALLENSTALTWVTIRDLAGIIREVEDEFETKVQTNPELCEEVLKRFNERRK